MVDAQQLAESFEVHRAHLQGVAYRMLGSRSEADDAVQEAWLRMSRADTDDVENLRGWLTTVVARVCLDQLRSRKARREEALGASVPEPAGGNPEDEAVVADSVGQALLVVLETLAPAERVAFVLHDLFAVPFDDIAAMVGRTPDAARQLASRARRRVRGVEEDSEGDIAAQRAVVDAFLAAARGGDLSTLLRLLDPDVRLDVDAAAAATGAERRLGAAAVADQFSGRARVARTALVDGAVGAVWSVGGKVRVVFDFLVQGGRVTGITLLADPDTLEGMDLEVFDRGEGSARGAAPRP